MKLLLDQNISHRVVKLIEQHFPFASSVKQEELTDANDVTVWQHAKQNGFAIVTFDEDFFNIQMAKGFPPKIIWFKTGNISNKQAADFLIAQKDMITSFISDEAYHNEGCLELFLLSPK